MKTRPDISGLKRGSLVQHPIVKHMTGRVIINKGHDSVVRWEDDKRYSFHNHDLLPIKRCECCGGRGFVNVERYG